MKAQGKDTLSSLVTALCADYKRRAEIMADRSKERRLRMECRYVNMRIFEAAAEVAGTALANLFIDEIGRAVGYASSEAVILSESTYKDYKRRIRIGIAKKLHLI
jgi:hypothetical protein